MGLVKYNNNSLTAVDDVSGSDGSMILIKTVTASSDSTISFVDGTSDVVLDDTYPIYVFKFINCHPQTDDVYFTFNMSVDSGSNYNVTKTTTFFRSQHSEDDANAQVVYRTAQDLAQSTNFQMLVQSLGGGADESVNGELWLFNPSSTTFTKQFISITNEYQAGNKTNQSFIGGYGNTTSAVDAVQFKMSSGNIDAGTLKLYGIKDS